MDRSGCHPILSNDDLDQYEEGKWKLNEPLSVNLVKKNQVPVRTVEVSKPIIGNIVERKPKAPVAPGAPKPKKETGTDVNGEKALPHHTDTTSSTGKGPIGDMSRDIDLENKQRITQMNPGDIAEDLEWIKSTLSDETIAFLKSKSARAPK